MPAKSKRNAIPRSRVISNAPVYPESSTPLSDDVPSVPSSFDDRPAITIRPGPWFQQDTAPDLDVVRDGAANIQLQGESPQLRETVFDGVVDGREQDEDSCARTIPAIPARPSDTPDPQLNDADATPAVTTHALQRDMTAGHVRSPVLSRELTTLETFSRTLRNYVPSAIPIPSVAPTPPRVSRPLSFGSFLNPVSTPMNTHRDADAGDQHRRRASEDTSSRRMSWTTQGAHDLGNNAIFSLDEEVIEDDLRHDAHLTSRYPAEKPPEQVVWARWDTLELSGCSKRLLFLGFRTGLQLWDCTNLGSVTELLNLSGDWAGATMASVLPRPRSPENDAFGEMRPLIGVLVAIGDRPEFRAYSLRTHQVVKTIYSPALRSFSSSPDFIVLSESHPPALRIVSSSAFVNLYTIHSSSLVPFAYPLPTPVNNNLNVSALDLERDSSAANIHQHKSIPQPIYAISNRLLAFASRVPSDLSFPSTPIPGRSGPFHMESDGGVKAGLGMSQADIGNAAVKLGGTVLSGMKSLGGLAISAARAGVSAAVSGELTTSPKATVDSSKGLSRMFSRSAPTDGTPLGGQHLDVLTGLRRPSDAIPPEKEKQQLPIFTDGQTVPPGCNITVIDLGPFLSDSTQAVPVKVADFTVSKSEPISHIRFSGNGTSVAASMKDGRVVRVFNIRPLSRAARSSVNDSSSLLGERTQAGYSAPSQPPPSISAAPNRSDHPWHVYNLRRGRTSAVVEEIDWANDGRWLALSTRKRTVHVFAINPYGGPPDQASHLLGNVVNVNALQPLRIDISPLVRVRSNATAEQVSAPLAATFVRSSEATMASTLLPAATVHYSTSPSSHSPTHSKPVSPAQRVQRPANYQDMLIFDPVDSTLSLRRIFVEKHTAEVSVPLSSSMPSSFGTSKQTNSSPRRPSGLTQMMEKSTEITGRETIVATWQLGRSQGWPEVHRVLSDDRSIPLITQPSSRPDWLSRAELSTCSASARILPRSIYLSHQFSFHAFGEDYHALLRGHNLDIPSTKVEVRREVEASAYPAGTGEPFMQGLTSPREMGHVSSSFDEPLASALTAELQPLNPSPPVLPMLPNGTPGSSSRSFKNPVPIRSVAVGITDGMSESLIRLRREIGKVRSPRLAARPDNDLSASVPLEFDEEDEEFAIHHMHPETLEERVISRSTSRGEGDSAASVSTPSTNLDPLPVEEDGGDVWQGWDPEDQRAVEDAERFDDITVGFMDEEQDTVREVGKKVQQRMALRRR
ncbi:hypothetical protein CERSUDRAFT_119431 [Gelatoporia subvermispora B]|uniref:BCAS3 WD40 domain-containing protein n=1 Tax=Ceriporiopsis subvermispora (strain B) TaxID=914234 RepID=M2P8Y4_CERS8|nr:hypothetical protein CERSUDRAFT_119431 [Gelatoporia subvermispora B]